MKTESRPQTRAGERVGGGIDPRIRARRAEVLRAHARRRLRVALGVVLLLAVACGAWALLHSRLFSARVVTVVGSVHTPIAVVVAAAGLSDHPPLVDVTGSAAAGVDRLPWVAHATVAREWPDGVRIAVRELTPVAAAPERAGWAVVDRSGKVLGLGTTAPAGLAHVSGSPDPGRPGTIWRTARPALAVASSLPRAFRNQVENVVESGADGVTLHLTSDLTVDLGSTVDLRAKYEDVAAILDGAPLSAGDVVDVAAPAAPVVRS